jgi:hypothetical protein
MKYNKIKKNYESPNLNIDHIPLNKYDKEQDE